jgi:tetraacyldisaccharide 4'-kinase
MMRAAIERAWWAARPGWLSHVLLPLASLYGLAWHGRRLAYAVGWLKAERAPVPVVVIGNLIVGGAGKTPTVIALVQALRQRGWTPGVISRGYGSHADHAREVGDQALAAECGDEPLLIRRRTHAPVWVGRRRVAVARALCAARPEVDVIVSDDGLQHHALARDAQLIVFDERGIGNGRLLPAGPLREPFSGAPPARSTVIYNASAPSTPWPGPRVQRALGGALPLRAWWAGDAASAQGLQALAGRPLLAAAGIASPQRFFDMLTAAGLRFDPLPLPDHAALEPRPWPAQTPCVVLTEKDAVKIPASAPDADKIHVATLDFPLPGETVDALLAWLEPQRPR